MGNINSEMKTNYNASAVESSYIFNVTNTVILKNKVVPVTKLNFFIKIIIEVVCFPA